MKYTDAEEVRCRMNKLGHILNEATDYGRRALPAEYADVERESRELGEVWQNFRHIKWKDGIEVEEAATPC